MFPFFPPNLAIICIVLRNFYDQMGRFFITVESCCCALVFLNINPRASADCIEQFFASFRSKVSPMQSLTIGWIEQHDGRFSINCISDEYLSLEKRLQ